MPTLLAAAEEKQARQRARARLLTFTAYTKPDYGPPPGKTPAGFADMPFSERLAAAHWHHRALADRLDKVARGECRRLMIFMPPQHGKSELVSRRFPAFILGRKPDTRLIQASHTYDLACSMNRDVQRIMTDAPYARLFPRSTLAHPSRDTIAARRTMGFFELAGQRGSLRSAGVGQSIAGNPADGAIIDDPFGKREDADSPTMRQKVWDWYANDLYTRLSAEAWIVLTHTRWHRDDLAGRLLRKMADRAADQWEILTLPAVREEGPGELCDPRQPGDPLWPDFKSAADLDIIRRQDPKAYAALYQQNPSDASNAEWSPEHFTGEFLWVREEHWPAHFDKRVVCVDPSKGRKDKQGDYCAIVFLGITRGLLYVDAIVERLPIEQIVQHTLRFCSRYQPDMVGFESVAFQEMLVHEFRRQCGDLFGLAWPVYAMASTAPKIERIRRLSQYVTNHELRFRADSPGCRLLVEQLIDFPLGDHDDGPDALEQCVRLPFEVMTR